MGKYEVKATVVEVIELPDEIVVAADCPQGSLFIPWQGEVPKVGDVLTVTITLGGSNENN